VNVFLTGATSGIGEALARLYAARGATLGLVGRREAALAALKSSLSVPASTYACDVRDGAALREAGADFLQHHGVPDLVIANAGVSHGTSTEIADDTETFREIVDINLVGIVNTFQPFVSAMRAQGTGTLAGIASVAGFRGLPGASAYSASKAAAISYLESLRIELHGSGVKVCTVCPGFIRTPMTSKNPYPMPFLLEVDDAARRIARAMDAGKSFAVVPWQMAIVGRILKLLPDSLLDSALAGRAPKPRKGS
jgi:short-subunit dehydrogenase